MNTVHPLTSLQDTEGYRLINSKFPPIALFDQVASAEDFDLMYALQSLTNPRLRAEVGELSLLPKSEIPFGIRGCSYATGAFTHVNANGSRFSDGSYGVMYIGDEQETAIAEVAHHQENYFKNVEGLKFERFVFRMLACRFSADSCTDISLLPLTDAVYDKANYSASQSLGRAVKQSGIESIQYSSVRRPSGICWALFTPKNVKSVIQSAHYEMVWDGKSISSISKLSN